MKFLPIALALLLIAVPLYAEDGDREIVNVKPDGETEVIDTFFIYAFTKTAEITYRQVDASGNGVGEKIYRFVNISDNPETVEDETDTSFTDFYNYLHTRIRAGDSMKDAIEKACDIYDANNP